MTSSDHSRYRGYHLRPQRQWSSWCVGIYPTRADLPLLARSILDTLSPRKNEAIEEAIDRALNEVGNPTSNVPSVQRIGGLCRSI